MLAHEQTHAPPKPSGCSLNDNLQRAVRAQSGQAGRCVVPEPQSLSNLLHERVSVTPDTAVRLAVALRKTPQMWLNLQANYDLWAIQT